MISIKFSLFIILMAVAAAALSQERDQEIIGIIVPREQQEARSRVELSKSRANYPVTPGDSYTLSYRMAGKDVTSEILVESDYTLNLNVFGKIKGEGLTFPQLKLKVEKIINDAYPNSLPYLVVSSVGMFQVYIKGEVLKTQFVTAWGLARLSEIIQPNLTDYSSLRDIAVVSFDGRQKSYDVFKALFRGALEEDPFVKLGDTITIARRSRQIELRGEIQKPGKYQILPGESVKEIIEYYGDGFTVLADRAQVKLMRIIEERPNTLHLDLRENYQGLEQIEDGDVITVPSKLDSLPVVAFEGAVIPRAATPATGVSESAAITGNNYGRITHPFADGETLKDALVAVKDSIAPFADLSSSYIIRKSDARIIPVDLEKLRFQYNPTEDLFLQPGDRVVIPAFRFNVSVIGAVQNPGTFLYVPQRNYTYYLTLAGGIPPGLTAGNITIVDANGIPRPIDAAVQPEDRIIVTETLISVVGGVYNAGTYAFVPGKTYEHYILLAGGINPEVNAYNWVSIKSAEGHRRKKNEPIQPGDRIYVHTNDFLYNFNKYFPVITSSAALITAVFTIINFLQQ
jgi:polysaccharide export outer membrane protein